LVLSTENRILLAPGENRPFSNPVRNKYCAGAVNPNNKFLNVFFLDSRGGRSHTFGLTHTNRVAPITYL